MRIRAKGALSLLLFCLAAVPAGLAQQKQAGSNGVYRANREDPPPQYKTTALRTLNLDEGLAILSVALDSRHNKSFSSDCSHFVHGLYTRAGFPYGYAPSSDLYAGIDEFRRVATPQPGDLAVWPGHAGIVVSPVQHSFFSLLRSGPGVDSYDAPYWKQRGRPRFFRYVKAGSSGALSTSLRTASLNPATLDNVEPREPESEDPAYGDKVSEDPASYASTEALSQPRSATKVAQNPAVDTTIPRPAVVHSNHPKPDQVSAAFLQTCTDSEENLRGYDLFKSAQPLIVFDHFAVSKVHIAGNQSWAEVRIDELASLTGGKAKVHKKSERERWPLVRRDKTSWELTAPRNTIYLPQQIAARILAQQLAQLTEDGANSPARPQQKAELARVLDSLLQE